MQVALFFVPKLHKNNLLTFDMENKTQLPAIMLACSQ